MARDSARVIGTRLCPRQFLTYMNFCPILECYADILLAVYGHEVYQRSPKPRIKLRQAFALSSKCLGKTIQTFRLCMSSLDGLNHFIMSAFHSLVTTDQFIIGGWRYNCFVVPRYIVLRNLPFILFYFLGQEINGSWAYRCRQSHHAHPGQHSCG